MRIIAIVLVALTLTLVATPVVANDELDQVELTPTSLNLVFTDGKGGTTEVLLEVRHVAISDIGINGGESSISASEFVRAWASARGKADIFLLEEVFYPRSNPEAKTWVIGVVQTPTRQGQSPYATYRVRYAAP